MRKFSQIASCSMPKTAGIGFPYCHSSRPAQATARSCNVPPEDALATKCYFSYPCCENFVSLLIYARRMIIITKQRAEEQNGRRLAVNSTHTFIAWTWSMVGGHGWYGWYRWQVRVCGQLVGMVLRTSFFGLNSGLRRSRVEKSFNIYFGTYFSYMLLSFKRRLFFWNTGSLVHNILIWYVGTYYYLLIIKKKKFYHWHVIYFYCDSLLGEPL